MYIYIERVKSTTELQKENLWQYASKKKKALKNKRFAKSVNFSKKFHHEYQCDLVFFSSLFQAS